MGHIVDSGELTVDASGEVKHVEVFVDCDGTPVGDVDVSFGLGEAREGIWESEEK